MIIKIKQEKGAGTITIDFKWTSKIAKERYIVKIESWTIGRTNEEISKVILDSLNKFKNSGILRI